MINYIKKKRRLLPGIQTKIAHFTIKEERGRLLSPPRSLKNHINGEKKPKHNEVARKTI